MQEETKSKERARECSRRYYREHKDELRERRRSYFLQYYHDVIKKNPKAVARRRSRALKYYYDHKDAMEVNNLKASKKGGINEH